MIDGVKFDEKKLRWDLMPFRELEDVVRVLMFGAEKYADDNWKKVPMPSTRYFAACMRHLSAWAQKEDVDQETGITHLAHAICCLLFLMHFDKEKTND